MIRFLLVLVYLAWSMACFTQSEYAVIDDVDGYVNVREAPGIHSKEIWGTDLSIPKQQIKQAYLEVGDQRVYLATTGFYEPNFNSTRLIYDETMDHFLITMVNSDGAGYYLCVWQISKNGDVERYAFLPY